MASSKDKDVKDVLNEIAHSELPTKDSSESKRWKLDLEPSQISALLPCRADLGAEGGF